MVQTGIRVSAASHADEATHNRYAEFLPSEAAEKAAQSISPGI